MGRDKGCLVCAGTGVTEVSCCLLSWYIWGLTVARNWFDFTSSGPFVVPPTPWTPPLSSRNGE